MEGPLSGDAGSKITVIHSGQIQQCSTSLKLASLGVSREGEWEGFRSFENTRTTMAAYMQVVKHKHGYRSLKEKYYEHYPYLGGDRNFGMSDMVESTEGMEEVVPINPIEEKDSQIAELMKALEDTKKNLSDMNAVKETLYKTRFELRTAQRASSLAKNKLEFARRVTEQRMSHCLSDATTDMEDELVALYYTLVDEDNFLLEDDTLAPKDDMLKNVDDKIVENLSLPL